MPNKKIKIDDLAEKNELERGLIAEKVGKSLSQKLDKVERVAVEQLAMSLVHDTAESVRKSLVKELLNCPYLPIEVAKEIANDIEDIASVFLHEFEDEASETLEVIARECEESAREILATRKGLPEPASFAISEVGAEKSISNLMENDTAVISERVCSVVTDRFNDNPNIMQNMAERSDLPLASIVKMVDYLSEEVASTLVKKYDLGDDLAHFISGQAKQFAIEESTKEASKEELVRFYTDLNKDNLLNGGLLLQLLQTSDLRRFNIAVGVRSEIESDKVGVILQNGEKSHFFRLMEKIKIADSLVPVLYDAYLELVNPSQDGVENEP